MIPQVERLFHMIEQRGWMGRIVPISHLADLQEAICSRFEHELIDEALYRDQLSSFRFDHPSDLSIVPRHSALDYKSPEVFEKSQRVTYLTVHQIG